MESSYRQDSLGSILCNLADLVYINVAAIEGNKNVATEAHEEMTPTLTSICYRGLGNRTLRSSFRVIPVAHIFQRFLQ